MVIEIKGVNEFDKSELAQKAYAIILKQISSICKQANMLDETYMQASSVIGHTDAVLEKEITELMDKVDLVSTISFRVIDDLMSYARRPDVTKDQVMRKLKSAVSVLEPVYIDVDSACRRVISEVELFSTPIKHYMEEK